MATTKLSQQIAEKKVAYAGVALTAVAMFVLAVALIFPSPTRAQDGDDITTSEDHEFKTFTVEVTQHLKSNAQNDVDPAEGQTLFSRGDTFIVGGSIYPDGSIPSGIAEPDPNARIIGKYRERGTFTGNTAAFTRSIAGDPAAPDIIAFATESFSLPDDNATILTDGIWPNARKSAYRECSAERDASAVLWAKYLNRTSEKTTTAFVIRA